MPRGRPRKNPVEGQAATVDTMPEASMPTASTQTETVTIEQPPKKKAQFKDWLGDFRIEDCKPFTTTEELPDDFVEYVEVKNADGHKVMSRKIQMGEPRFYLSRTQNGWYNLIAVYKNGKGVGRRNVRTLKPKDLNRMTGAHPVLLDKIKKDNEMLEILKANKIPIEQEYSAVR